MGGNGPNKGDGPDKESEHDKEVENDKEHTDDKPNKPDGGRPDKDDEDKPTKPNEEKDDTSGKDETIDENKPSEYKPSNVLSIAKIDHSIKQIQATYSNNLKLSDVNAVGQERTKIAVEKCIIRTLTQCIQNDEKASIYMPSENMEKITDLKSLIGGLDNAIAKNSYKVTKTWRPFVAACANDDSKIRAVSKAVQKEAMDAKQLPSKGGYSLMACKNGLKKVPAAISAAIKAGV